MASPVSQFVREEIEYPSGDGKPMAETPRHRQNLTDLIDMLSGWYADEPKVYVSGNMFIYYVRGNKHKHVAPDVFVAKGIPKDKVRDYYLVWEERRPDTIIEITSKTTAQEDHEEKLRLYRDVLKVPEYFLFDPLREYQTPPLIGYRLHDGEYVRIEEVDGRVPSEVLGLHLEACGSVLRFFDPATGQYVPTTAEVLAQTAEALAQEKRDNEKLKRELRKLRRQRGTKDKGA